MGGRGSLYTTYSNANAGGSDLPNLFFEEEENDTEKEYNGKTEKLKGKNIHIKESTDDLPEDIFIPNINKIDSLSRKYLKTQQILKDTEQQISIKSRNLDNNAVACFSFLPDEFTNMSIQLDKRTFKNAKNRQSYEKDVAEQIRQGHWLKTDAKEYVNSTISHEYGHYVQRVLMELDRQTPEGKKIYEDFKNSYRSAKTKSARTHIAKSYREAYATKYFKAIQREHRKYFNKEQDIDEIMSGYGKESDREAFAELFMHLNCSKQPNTFAQAMESFLNKKLNPEDKQRLHKLTKQ